MIRRALALAVVTSTLVGCHSTPHPTTPIGVALDASECDQYDNLQHLRQARPNPSDSCIAAFLARGWGATAATTGLRLRSAPTDADAINRIFADGGRGTVAINGLVGKPLTVLVVTAPSPIFESRGGPGPGAQPQVDELIAIFPTDRSGEELGESLAMHDSELGQAIDRAIGTGP